VRQLPIVLLLLILIGGPVLILIVQAGAPGWRYLELCRT
jgi:hypothetical protein